jgi:hypothetical protein
MTPLCPPSRAVVLTTLAARLRLVARQVAEIRGAPQDRNAQQENLADDLLDIADKITVVAVRHE